MAETLVENKVCNACGADVRPGALFCYSCGKSVTLRSDIVDNNNNENGGDIRLHDDIIKGNGNLDKLAKEGLLAEQNTQTRLEEFSEKTVTKPNIQEQVKLKSAASLRRKSKILQKKRVEVVWEEQEDVPNIWFIIVAISLTIFAIIVVYLAMYLR
ncbi:MAG: hypothetical protein ABR566_03755 [Pyrinomonadaceae bacterium]